MLISDTIHPGAMGKIQDLEGKPSMKVEDQGQMEPLGPPQFEQHIGDLQLAQRAVAIQEGDAVVFQANLVPVKDSTMTIGIFNIDFLLVIEILI